MDPRAVPVLADRVANVSGAGRCPEFPAEAVVIYEIDPSTDTILAGHYYSEKVGRGGPGINPWIQALGQPTQAG